MKYLELSQKVLEHVGGVENLDNVQRCATRLRLHYKDKSLIHEEELKKIEGVVGVVSKVGQVQIIIGPSVPEVYADFIEVSGFRAENGDRAKTEVKAAEDEKKDFMYYMTKFGNTCAAVFMPIVPALITGGLILSIKNLLVNYFGMGVDSGTAQVMLAIFSAAFPFLPVYIGYTLANTLKLEPIMGAFLGALLVSPSVSGAEGLDFFGIAIPAINYESSVMPVVMGVILMYFVDRLFKKVIPESIKYFIKPLLTMIIVTPIVLIVLGPLGTRLSTYVGNAVVAMQETMGGFAIPILSALYPYMVMFGLDKTAMAIGFGIVAEIGYDPVILIMGFISNLCIGGTALAVAAATRNDKAKRGMIASLGVTALCGVTEPAFYGSLIMRPKVLIGTAIGAVSAGLVAGLFGLVSYVEGGCPGLLTALFFIGPDGSLGMLFLAAVVAAVSVAVSFAASLFILRKTENEKGARKI